MAISVARNARSPPSPTPSHMLINSILIQTDDGRKFDSSIIYNRIVDDPYYRRKRSYLRPVVAGLVTIAISACLMVSESIGFSSFPLAATKRKYLGRRPNIGLSSSEDEDVANALVLVDDEIDDELRGTEDDDLQYGDTPASSTNGDAKQATEKNVLPEAEDFRNGDENDEDDNASVSRSGGEQIAAEPEGTQVPEAEDVQDSGDEADEEVEEPSAVKSDDAQNGHTDALTINEDRDDAMENEGGAEEDDGDDGAGDTHNANTSTSVGLEDDEANGNNSTSNNSGVVMEKDDAAANASEGSSVENGQVKEVEGRDNKRIMNKYDAVLKYHGNGKPKKKADVPPEVEGESDVTR